MGFCRLVECLSRYSMCMGLPFPCRWSCLNPQISRMRHLAANLTIASARAQLGMINLGTPENLPEDLLLEEMFGLPATAELVDGHGQQQHNATHGVLVKRLDVH
jgi:hypothetical protein